MCPRKFFNLLNADQKIIIQYEIEEFDKIVLEKVNQINSNEKTTKVRINNTCPKCGGYKLGDISVINSNIPKDINNCLFCGHQWKKYECKFVTIAEIKQKYIDIISDSLNNNKKNEDFLFLFEKIKLLRAETIYQIIKTVKLKTVRKYFTSIFNI